MTIKPSAAWCFALALSATNLAVATVTIESNSASTAPRSSSSNSGSVDNQRVVTALANIPLAFEANIGQVPDHVKFVARQGLHSVFLESDKIRWTLPASKTNISTSTAKTSTSQPAAPTPSINVGMHFAGAQQGVELEAQNKLGWETNYFIGKDSSQWKTGVQNFAKVTYKQVYPGIDVAFYGSGKQLEYDLILAPGAKTDAIRLGFSGVDHLAISAEGDLVLTTGTTEMRQMKPVIYQEKNGVKEAIEGKYVLLENQQVAFQVANYDHAKALVIDPVIVYSTFYGHVGFDTPRSIVIDTDGLAVIAGEVGQGYPSDFGYVNNNNRNAFVAKLNADGSGLIYSSVLSGTAFEEANKVILDSQSNPILVGRTLSSDFPTTANAYQTTLKGLSDTFVAKLSSDGRTLLFSTLLGGASSEGGYTLALDNDGGIYVGGHTGSFDFPLVSPIQSGPYQFSPMFISKLSGDGSSLQFSTYFGLCAGLKQSEVRDMAVDPSGNLYVVGISECPTFPTLNPAQNYSGGYDVVLLKLRSDHTLVYSTFLGGTADEDTLSMALDNNGEVIVGGLTKSTNFPVTANAVQSTFGGGGDRGIGDAFFAKLSADGSRFVYATYFGGNNYDFVWKAAIDKGHNAYFVGYTTSTNFPLLDSIKTIKEGTTDAFVVMIGPNGSPVYYSTMFGGNRDDAAYAVAVSNAGEVFVAGTTDSLNFPVTPTAFDKLNSQDAFVVKLSKMELAPFAISGADQSISEGEPVTLDGSQSYDPNGDVITSYTWSQVAGPAVLLNTSNPQRPTFTAPDVPTGGATLTFQLVVNDGVLASAAVVVNVTVKNVNHAPVADAGIDQTVTEGALVNLNGAQSYDSDNDTLSYQWQQVSGATVVLSDPSSSAPTFNAPLVTTSASLQFSLTVSDGSLTATDQITVLVENVNHPPVADAGVDQTVNEGSQVTLDGRNSSDPDNDLLSFSWTQLSGGQVVLSDTIVPTPQFQAPQVGLGGDTLVFGLRTNDGAINSAEDTVSVKVLDLNDPPACTLAQPKHPLLWPPNHKLVPIVITGISDANNDQVTLSITRVEQDELVDGHGDGDTARDAFYHAGWAFVRAERSGAGDGRIYIIYFTATDGQGGSCSGSVKVGVPKNRNTAPVDSGLRYDSTLYTPHEHEDD